MALLHARPKRRHVAFAALLAVVVVAFQAASGTASVADTEDSQTGLKDGDRLSGEIHSERGATLEPQATDPLDPQELVNSDTLASEARDFFGDRYGFIAFGTAKGSPAFIGVVSPTERDSEFLERFDDAEQNVLRLTDTPHSEAELLVSLQKVTSLFLESNVDRTLIGLEMVYDLNDIPARLVVSVRTPSHELIDMATAAAPADHLVTTLTAEDEMYGFFTTD